MDTNPKIIEVAIVDNFIAMVTMKIRHVSSYKLLYISNS